MSQLMDYLESNGLLSIHQFGFHKGRCVENQLLVTYAEVVDAVDRSLTVNMIYLDFSKAFDVVSHFILEKLEMLCVCGKLLVWIRAFLFGHTMYFKVAGNVISLREVTRGVPQGSVLGPVLLLIYANCIVTSVTCTWKAFADDYKLYHRFPRDTCVPILLGMMQLQKDLDKVCLVTKS